MLEYDWRKVRCVDLTYDRKKFKTPADALAHGGKNVSYLIDNLRHHGIEVLNWRKFLEWHADGYPHYHLYIEVAESGRAGMIGYDLLQELWDAGMVREWPVKSKAHWEHIIGYAAKTGYLHKPKRHQVVFPEWLLDTKMRVRRTSGGSANPDTSKMITPKEKENYMRGLIKKCKKNTSGAKQTAHISSSHPKTNREALAECGATINVTYILSPTKTIEPGIASIPFKEWKESGARYIDGLGWCKNVTSEELGTFNETNYKRFPVERPPSMGERAGERRSPPKSKPGGKYTRTSKPQGKWVHKNPFAEARLYD